ncbi:MAG: HAMP domain-containing histidine kinase [Firmicutes bacterium]|nr:HAMP domain-containing histidine kinase [Bacillota bacterium]
MHTRKITRFHPRRALSQPRHGLAWFLAKHSGWVLTTLVILVVAWGLWWVPRQHTQNLYFDLQAKYSEDHFENAQRVERHWMDYPNLPAFTQGDEPWVKTFLTQQPMVVALFDRRNLALAWKREGDRLVRAEHDAEMELYRPWAAWAEESRRFQWTPDESQVPSDFEAAYTLLLGDRYMMVKAWKPGSPRVEEALRLLFGAHPPARIGLVHVTHPRPGAKEPRPAWGAEPNIQADVGRISDSPFSFSGSSDFFGENWSLEIIPWRAEVKQIGRDFFFKRRLSQGIALAVGLALLGGFWMVRRAKKREALDSDRLAALMHSLKTPLAVLKFRCDSLRLGRVKDDQADVELIRISEEVDTLSNMIGQGLSALRGEGQVGPQDEVNPLWLMGVAEDLHGAFETENRLLELKFCSEIGKANLPSLRSALLTLLENALFHGKGKVTFETYRKGKRFHLKVTDQGPGLDATQLASLGKPFMRFRQRGREGFDREGQGLGLSLLCQVAEREGWGLSFASEPDRGFHAQLVVEAA